MNGNLRIAQPQACKHGSCSFLGGSFLKVDQAIQGSNYTFDQWTQVDINILRDPHQTCHTGQRLGHLLKSKSDNTKAGMVVADESKGSWSCCSSEVFGVDQDAARCFGFGQVFRVVVVLLCVVVLKISGCGVVLCSLFAASDRCHVLIFSPSIKLWYTICVLSKKNNSKAVLIRHNIHLRKNTCNY